MAEANVPLYAFNRGLISKTALARSDLSRMALSAEKQTNFMPKELGPMSLRVGMEYQGSTYENAKARQIPFVFATDDTATIELTDSVMRVWLDDTLVSRPSHGTTIANGNFDTDLTSWTDDDETGAVSSWENGGYLALQGTTAGASASRYQKLSIAPADTAKLHTLRVTVNRGPITFQVGSTVNGVDLYPATVLDTGVHSLQFKPNSIEAYVQLTSNTRYTSRVSSVELEASGTLELPTLWREADLPFVRSTPSGSILYIACTGIRQQYIQRGQFGSWSICDYITTDGPFDNVNTTTTSISSTDIIGDVTLTASKTLFRQSDVGTLFQLTSTGQQVTASFTDENQQSEDVLVTGVTTGRIVDIIRTGTWTGTLTLQRSIDLPGSWIDVKTYTTNATDSYDDGLDNQVTYYRVIVKAGDWTSGSAEVTISYPSGSRDGVVRLTSVSNGTTATASILRSLGGTSATTEWRRGLWSSTKGYPSTVTITEGRLWWIGKGRYQGSVSDVFDSFDASTEGDSGPILRGIGFGPVDRVPWASASERLLIGTHGNELSIRSSNESEPLTNTNVTVKGGSNQGSADVDNEVVDSSIIFVQRCKSRVYSLEYAFEPNSYIAKELSLLVPELCRPEIVRLCVQRKPDTRIHCILSTGKVAVCLFNKAEEINCWIVLETDGVVEDAIALSGVEEDSVYYIVKRTIDGSEVRYREKWSLESDSTVWTHVKESDTSFSTVTNMGFPDGTVLTLRDSYGDKVENLTVADDSVTLTTATTAAYLTPAMCKLADSHLLYEGAAQSTINGLDHLEGEEVVVWGDGKVQGTFTVASGAITLSEEVEVACIGLSYSAAFTSTKLAYADTQGTALSQVKRVHKLAPLAFNTHREGFYYGSDPDNLYNPPLVHAPYEDQRVEVVEEYDSQALSFPGVHDTDSRVYMKAQAPYPCTVAGIVIEMETLDE